MTTNNHTNNTQSIPELNVNDEQFIGRHIEDLLSIASFLTAVQTVLPQKVGWITVHDVATVLRYRVLLEQKEFMEGQESAHQHLRMMMMTKNDGENDLHDDVEEAQVTPTHGAYQAVQQSLRAFPARIADLHVYWRKVEVLFTKAFVVEDALLRGDWYWNVPVTEKDGNNVATLDLGELTAQWNKYLPRLQASHPNVRSQLLSVLPDEYTWSEWALGLAYNNPGEASDERPTPNMDDSPYDSELLQNSLRQKNSRPGYIYRTGDLKLLEKRSRHCITSLRHLLQLFVVKRETNEHGGEIYTAELRGNHKDTYQRVKKNTALVETLVAHAIHQQVTVIAPTVMEHLRGTWRAKVEQAKPDDSQETSEPVPKKAKLSLSIRQLVKNLTVDNERDEMALKRACRRVLLRTWGRRHAACLFPLFHSEYTPEPYDLLHLTPMSMNVAQSIKRALQRATEERSQSVDQLYHSLEGMDGLLSAGRYIHHDSFQSSVENLLTNFLRVLSDPKMENDLNIHRKQVSAALHDWRRTCQTFREIAASDGITAAAASLVEKDVPPMIQLTSADSCRRLLEGCPAPWAMGYSHEKRSAPGRLRSCVACEKWLHDPSGCLFGKTYKVESFLKSSEPLKRLFTVKPPLSKQALPPHSWERLEIVVERQRDENTGELPTFGLIFVHTKRCDQFFQKWAAGDILVSEVEKYKGLIPIKAERYGFLVSGRGDGIVPIHDCGLEVGDIIIGIETMVFDDSAGVSWTPQKYDVTDETHQNLVLQLLKSSCTKFRFTIERPSTNPIPSMLFEWDKCLENSALQTQVCRVHPGFWFCNECQTRGYVAHDVDIPEHVRMALLCRSVVRRLAVQPYATHFLFENHVTVETLVTDGYRQCISLKRLDMILTSIIREENLWTDKKSALHFRERPLSWIRNTEDPGEILWRGLDLLVSGESGHPVSIDERRMLLQDSMRLFAAWCLWPDSRSLDIVCPVFNVCGVMEWNESSLCPTCSVLHKLEKDVCHLCEKTSRSISDNLTNVEAIACIYEKKASLVGSTVLFLPGDPILAPILEALEKERVKLEPLQRPVEFIVAAYLPFDVIGETTKNEFFLLPIVNEQQLSFLASRVNMAEPRTEISDATLQAWMNDGILNLKGVLSLSYTDLRQRLQVTKGIIASIRMEIVKTSNHDLLDQATVEEPTMMCTGGSLSSLPSKVLSSNRRLISASCSSAFFSGIFDSELDAQLSTAQTENIFDWKVDQPIAPSITRQSALLPTEADLCSFDLSFPYSAPITLLYSDLFFDSPESKSVFELKHAAVVHEIGTSWDVVRIVLEVNQPRLKSTASRSFSNIGWGFEVLSGKGGSALVGRVDESGVAFECGLRQGDEILEINAKKTASFSDASEFAKIFQSCALENLPRDDPGRACLLSLKHNFILKKRPGPLVFFVRRSHVPLNGSTPRVSAGTSVTNDSTVTLQEAPRAASQSRTLPSQAKLAAGTADTICYLSAENAEEAVHTFLRMGRLSSSSSRVDVAKATLRLFNDWYSAGYTFAAVIGSDGIYQPLNKEPAKRIMIKMMCEAFLRRFPPRGPERQETAQMVDGSNRGVPNHLLDAPTAPAAPPKSVPNRHNTAAQTPVHSIDQRGPIVHRAVPNPLSDAPAAPTEAPKNVPNRYDLAGQPSLPPLNNPRQAVQMVAAAVAHPHQNSRDFAHSPMHYTHYERIIQNLDLQGYCCSASTLREQDLDICGPGEFVFTHGELAVFLRAIVEKKIMLGYVDDPAVGSSLIQCTHIKCSSFFVTSFRLLMPRYRFQQISSEFMKLKNFDLSLLRLLPRGFWREILVRDYNRAMIESDTDPARLVDPDFEYRIPQRPFPIDLKLRVVFRNIPRASQGAIVIDDHIDRIRGGGPENEDRVCLASLASEDWQGKLVYTRLVIAFNETNKIPRTVIGDVVEVISGEKVRLRVFHHMKTGVVDPEEIIVNAETTFLVKEGSKKWDSVQNARKVIRRTSRTVGIQDNSEQSTLESTDSPVKRQGEHVMYRRLLELLRMRREERNDVIVKSVCFQKHPFIALGSLPDHRTIYWHPLDKDALYISPTATDSDSVRFMYFYECLDRWEHVKDASLHICRWCQSNDSSGSFHSHDDLLQHLQVVHNVPTNAHFENLKRTTDKSEIDKLFHALCGVVRSFFRVKGLWEFNLDNGTTEFVATQFTQDDEEMLSQAWGKASMIEKEALLTLVNWNSLYGTSLGSRNVSSENSAESTNTTDSETVTRPSFAQAKNVVLSALESIGEVLVKPPFHSHLGCSTGVHNVGKKLNSFRMAVLSCRTVAGLAQLWAHFTYCVNLDLFSSVWKGDAGGWNSAQPLLVEPSLSALILRVQIFRESIAQAIQYAARATCPLSSLPCKPFPPNYLELVEEIAGVSQEKGIPPWNGPCDELCYECEQIGTARLRCSFCPSNLCKLCYDTNELPTPPRFVCHACLVDISSGIQV